MKNLKKLFLSLLFVSFMISCGNSDVIVNIYGASEYNCTTDEYKILKPNLLVSFLKTKKWYTRDQFHKANVKAAIKPYEGLPVSIETLEEISPSFELSNAMFNELIAPVDCQNPRDIKF